MKLPRIKLKNIKDFLTKLPKTLGDHAFLTFLGFLFLAFIIGGIIFQKYSISAEKEMPGVGEKPLQFKENTYQKVLEIWQKKEKKFEEADFKQYPDPFRGIKVEPSEPGPGPEEEPGETPSEVPTDITERLLLATNLMKYYAIKGEYLPPLYVRARLWQEKGLGPAGEYVGSRSQNLRLLAELKRELTE